jgi:hypothetical protein
VRRLVDRLAETGTDACEQQHADRGREAGEHAEERPRDRAGCRHAHAVALVGLVSDRQAEDQRHHAERGDEPEDPLVREVERVADLG